MKKLPVSVCVITRNNEATIDKCLSSLYNIFDEIVIVDTGSTDATLEIAGKYTSNISEFHWNNDFAQARNYAVSKAQHNFIFSIDSDESLKSMDETQLLNFIDTNPDNCIGQIEILNLQEDGTFQHDHVSRIFNREHFHFEGTVHEQLVPENHRIIPLKIQIVHYGYADKAANIRKAGMYRKMLLAELEEKPDDGYILYQIGRTYDIEKNYSKAADAYTAAICHTPDHNLSYFRSCLDELCYALINISKPETAADIINKIGYPYEDADGYFLFGHLYMNLGNFSEAVKCFEKATTFKNCSRPGANSFAACYNAGVIYEVLGFKEQAIESYRRCGNYEKAVKRLETLE